MIVSICMFRHESGGWEHIFVLWDGSVMFLEFIFYQIVVKVQLDCQSNVHIYCVKRKVQIM